MLMFLNYINNVQLKKKKTMRPSCEVCVASAKMAGVHVSLFI